MRRVLLAAAAASGLAAFAPGHARAAPSYTFTTISDPNAPYFTAPSGINDAGQIVGMYDITSPTLTLNGFLRDAAGNFTTINDPNSPGNTEPNAINNAGQIVGSSSAGAFLRGAAGNFTTINGPSGMSSIGADGINDVGEIVGGISGQGYVRDAAGNFTTFSDPNLPPNASTVAGGINNAGQIVGNASLTTYNGPLPVYQSDSFLRDALGNFTTINDPNATLATGVFGINNAGEIVGQYIDNSGVHGYVRDAAGNFTTIDDPNGIDRYGASSTFALGINDAGQIVGFYNPNDNPGAIEGFLATPVDTSVPEPASLTLLGAGLLGFGLIRRRTAA